MTRASRILVVDDDPTIRDVPARYLAHAGFAVDTAEDGLQALASVAEHWPDLVVLDLMLPGPRRHRGLPAAARQHAGPGGDADRPR